MPSSGNTRRRPACVLVMLCGSILLRAQSPVGQIQLTVKDPSGVGMDASGKLQNLANGTSRSFETTGQGTFTLEAVPYGRYRLELSRTGFANQSLLVDVQSELPISR